MTTQESARIPPDALLIDGMNITFRAMFALQVGKPDTDGEMIAQAAHRSISSWIARYGAGARRAMVIFDGDGASESRRAIYPAYKFGRATRADAMTDALPILRQMLADGGARSLKLNGYEADDVIATYCRLLSAKKLRTLVVTSDRDLLQVIDAHTSVVQPQKPKVDPVVYDDDRFASDYGFAPVRLADYKAICGDKSDSIPGARGLGDVKARALLRAYHGGIDEIYEHATTRDAWLWPKNVCLLLKQHEAHIRRNLLLTTLNREVPGVELRGAAAD